MARRAELAHVNGLSHVQTGNLHWYALFALFGIIAASRGAGRMADAILNVAVPARRRHCGCSRCPREGGLVRGLSLATMLLQFALTAWLYIRLIRPSPACNSDKLLIACGACITRSDSMATTCYSCC
jgi:hypothetical protein